MKKITSLFTILLLCCSTGLFAAAAADGRGDGMVTPPPSPGPLNKEEANLRRRDKHAASKAMTEEDRKAMGAVPGWAADFWLSDGEVTPPSSSRRSSDEEMIRQLDQQRLVERLAASARVAAARQAAMAAPAWTAWTGRGPLFPVLPGSDRPDTE